MFRHPPQRRDTAYVVAMAALAVGFLAVVTGWLLML